MGDITDVLCGLVTAGRHNKGFNVLFKDDRSMFPHNFRSIMRVTKALCKDRCFQKIFQYFALLYNADLVDVFNL